MGERAEEMVRIALDSFSSAGRRARASHSSSWTSSSTARTAGSTDKVLALVLAPGSQEWGMRMIVVARCLERVGDNAVDIGEQTAFVVTGEFHEFTDASH